jgi:adenosylcobinamide amidohydrolase
MDDVMDQNDLYELKRRGRFLMAELLVPHRVLNTSVCGGGLRDDIRYLVNHQSCEGSGHEARFVLIKQLGEEGYHQQVCDELGLDANTVALMGTAANMNYAACVTETHQALRVCAVVTAGVAGNAGCAGDPASWYEEDVAEREKHPHEGTINTMLLVNWPLTPGAMARAVVTMTEGKSAALRDLAISSRYSQDLATGTGTDQYCIATPLDETKQPKTNAGHHSKLGELIGTAVRKATLEALRWQNGLEASYTRGVVHALRRFGFKEDLFFAEMEARLSADDFVLLKKNLKPVLYEPQVSAAAFAFAAVWDRVRYGTVSGALAAPVLRQQAATLATSLAANPDMWFLCYEQLEVNEDAFLDVVYDALALGWRLKWM